MKTFYDAALTDRDLIKQNLTNSLIQFFRLRDQQAVLTESIKGKGDKAARSKNLKEKQDELAALRAIAGFTEEDERKYNLLDLEKKRHASRVITLQLLYNNYQTIYPAELSRILKIIETSFDGFGTLAKSKFSDHPIAGISLSNLVAGDKQQVVDLFQSLIRKSAAKAEKVERLLNMTITRAESCDISRNPISIKFRTDPS